MGRRAGLQQNARRQSGLGERMQREEERRAEAEELGAPGGGELPLFLPTPPLLFPLFFFGANMLGIGLGGGQRGACNERCLHTVLSLVRGPPYKCHYYRY